MSTFYIYPLEHLSNNKQDESPAAITTLSSNGLSRILEIPLNLLDADTNQKFNNKNATDQLFWLSTTTAATANSTNNTTTANTNNNNNNNSSTPTVTNHCENNNNNNSTEITHSFANRKRSIVKRRKSVLSASYTAEDEAEAIKIDREAALATLERGTKEETPKKDNILIEAPQEDRGSLEGGLSKVNTIYNMEQITPKDSAIDLRTSTLEPEDLKIIETSSPIIESTSFTSPPSPTLTPAIVMTTKKKKGSSWSPRKIFQSNTRKKETKPEKFNISSLFSRSLNKKPSLKSTSSKSVLINSTNNNLETKKDDFQLKSNFNYTRLPIHTERAIYRLSHLKLTNPRRPLCDQVTISNLMFWYLSIISQQNTSSHENDLITDIPFDSTMTKKSCRIQIQQRRSSNKKRSSNINTGNKRIRNHQIGPDLQNNNNHSNAMDTLNNKQRYKNTHLRTNNSSSDEDDEEGFSDDDLSDIEDECIPELYNDKKKKKGKYSLFQKNHHWLSFSSKHERQDEDDIPLAMYQKKEKNSLKLD